MIFNQTTTIAKRKIAICACLFVFLAILSEISLRQIPFQRLLSSDVFMHSGIYRVRHLKTTSLLIGEKGFSCKPSAIEFNACSRIGPLNQELKVWYRISRGVLSDTFIATKITESSTGNLLFEQRDFDEMYLENSRMIVRGFLLGLNILILITAIFAPANLNNVFKGKVNV